MIILKSKLLLLLGGVLIAISGALFVSTAIAKYNRMKADLATSTQNNLAYVDIIVGERADKAILKLTVDDLAMSKDSLLKELESARKRLKVALNKPGDIGIVSGSKIDTVFVEKIEMDSVCNFKETIKPNDLTTFDIEVKDGELFFHPEINNSTIIFVHSDREYVNEYRSGWVRFWHFDWKKRPVERYNIENTNDLIKETGTRVVKIED